MTKFKSPMEKAAWERVQNLDEFHWTDLVQKGCVERTAKTFVKRWRIAGMIHQTRKEGHRLFFTNAARKLHPMPELAKLLSEEDAIWTIMRRLKRFTPTDVAAHVNAGNFNVAVDEVSRYCGRLASVGYLKRLQTAIPDVRDAAYLLINDTGPAAPYLRRVSGMFDPNIKDFTPLKDLS